MECQTWEGVTSFLETRQIEAVEPYNLDAHGARDKSWATSAGAI